MPVFPENGDTDKVMGTNSETWYGLFIQVENQTLKVR